MDKTKAAVDPQELKVYRLRAYRSSPPFAEAAAAAAFALRAVFGFASTFASPLVTQLSPFAAAFFAFLAWRSLRRASRGGDARFSQDPRSRVRQLPLARRLLAPALPFAAGTLSLGLDAVTVQAQTAVPWALLVLAAGAITPSLSSFFISACLPLAAGAVFACLIPGFPPEPTIVLIVSAVFSSLAYASRRTEALRAFQEAAARVERARAASSLRDAEVEIAARIQRALLLDVPSSVSRGFKLEALTVASNSVDGDFYGFVPYEQDSVDILVGDVMGKGVPAALLGAAIKSAFLRSSLRLLVADPGASPRLETLLGVVHESLSGEMAALESFATLQYARVDSRRRRLDFVDCGHTPILHWDAEFGCCWAIKGTDLPMGFSEEHSYRAYSVPLSPGDRLVFYSDGVTEAVNEKGEFFGEKRLADMVKDNAALEPAELVRRILNTAMYFTSSVGFRDDVTCVALSLEPNEHVPYRATKRCAASPEAAADLREFLEGELRVATEFPGSEEFSARVVRAATEAAAAAVERGCVEPEGVESEEAALEDAAVAEPAAAAVAVPPGPKPLRAGELVCEFRSTPTWVSVRLAYRGEAFPWHRPNGTADFESVMNPEDGCAAGGLPADWASSALYASGPGDYCLVCLVFDAPEAPLA